MTLPLKKDLYLHFSKKFWDRDFQKISEVKDETNPEILALLLYS